MAYISDYQYYENGGVAPEEANWGSYQYVTLRDIVTNFQMMYTGNHELVNNIDRYKIVFHAKRAIQELNYDAMKELKILPLKQLYFMLNFVRSIKAKKMEKSRLENGWKRNLYVL